MKDIDWSLAVLLAAVFVVSSVLRWRYFQRLGRRGKTPPPEAGTDEGSEP